MEKFCSIFSFVSLRNLKQAEALGVLIGDQCKPLNNFMTTCIVLHVENGRKKKKKKTMENGLPQMFPTLAGCEYGSK